VDPQTILITLTLVQTLVNNGPAGIKAVQDIMLAWKKQDPTSEDFDALAALIEQYRPKDPLGKV
jgi:3-deoxy-D-arabino-heptulosonate 7-phosphate (DAHP) synthase class II